MEPIPTSFRDWTAWAWDGPTIFWVAWIAVFFVGEYFTSGVSPIPSWRDNMLTDHLRPVFLSAPITWFITLGLVVWLIFHFLIPSLEEGILRMVSRDLGSH
jgi:hypothetical protein